MFGLSTKTAWGFFVILGIFTALVIFGNTISSKKITKILPTPPEQVMANISDGVIGEPLPAPREETINGNGEPENTNRDDGNLTKHLASIIGKSIVDRNPKGPQDGSFVVQDTEKITADAVGETIKNFDASRFMPTILPTDIIIDATMSEATYRAAIKKIITDKEVNFIPNPDATPTERLTAIARHYGELADALKKIPVPPTLATEHEQILRLALAKKTMIETAANYDTDPIYALVALKAWNTIR